MFFNAHHRPPIDIKPQKLIQVQLEYGSYFLPLLAFPDFVPDALGVAFALALAFAALSDCLLLFLGGSLFGRRGLASHKRKPNHVICWKGLLKFEWI